MARGGRQKDRDGPERRCIVTGESGPTARLIRLVLAPDGATVVPDLAGKLPGRGAWLSSERGLVERAVAKRHFARAFRRPVTVPDELPTLLERLLAQRLIDAVSLARKAGAAVTGFEKVRARLLGPPAILLTAHDAGREGRRKLRKIAPRACEIALLDASELGLAFGREFAIHAALDAGGIAERALHEADRLSGFRITPPFADAEDAGSMPATVPVVDDGDDMGAETRPPEVD
ncbi:MAG: RNA-binding protein [Pseudomonadota bacterium]